MKPTKPLAILAFLSVLVLAIMNLPDDKMNENATGAVDADERGPNGGRLLRDGDFSLEVVIFEAGVPPEFHLYATMGEQPIKPGNYSAEIELLRLGGVVDQFNFSPEDDYLLGSGIVREPHSFDVRVSAGFNGRSFQWQYESYEGRTRIPDRIATESGIVVSEAGPQTIVSSVELTGTIQTNPAGVSLVRARFPGIVTSVETSTGDQVRSGDVLAHVETNESLRSVPVHAPISGIIVNRNIQVGQVTGEDPLFTIADLSEVWAQLDVFGKDLNAVAVGQEVEITTLDELVYAGIIDWVSPLVAHGSQSLRVRVPLPNPTGSLRAGQFVRATVAVAETEVPLAVARSAVQTYRDFNVVYARVDDVYEVRMLELGRFDREHIEVLGGLSPGELYVTKNSYLIKADIEKSGASHDH
jgi:cobalt-zinc-cadmium efflux system membrane fusion protein